MNIFQKQIINRFNKAASHYDKLCLPQKESAQLLAKTLNNKYPFFMPKTILDLGTGTGIMVEKTLEYYPDAHYSLNDNAQNMLKECQKKFSNLNKISYIESSMQEIPAQYYDLITSNFSLQWIKSPYDIIKKFSQSCKIFAFTYVINGTFKEWYEILSDYNIIHNSANFPTQHELEEICNSLSDKCHYFIQNYNLEFENYASFATYLKFLGASATESYISISNLKKILKLENKITTSYKVFFGFIEVN